MPLTYDPDVSIPGNQLVTQHLIFEDPIVTLIVPQQTIPIEDHFGQS